MHKENTKLEFTVAYTRRISQCVVTKLKKTHMFDLLLEGISRRRNYTIYSCIYKPTYLIKLEKGRKVDYETISSVYSKFMITSDTFRLKR